MSRNYVLPSYPPTEMSYTATATLAINASDLVVQFENGDIVAANSNLPMSHWNNQTVGALLTTAEAALTAASLWTQVWGPTSDVLISGNIVVTFPGTSGFPHFMIYGPTGVVVTASTAVASAGACSLSPYVAALSGGNFAMLWQEGGELYYAVYGPTGTAVQARTSIDSLVAASGNYYALTALKQNGWFAVAYQNNSSWVVACLYNGSGTSQHTGISPGGGIAGSNFGLSGCANGDTLVSFTGSSAWFRYAYRITQAGSVANSLTYATGFGTPTSGTQIANAMSHMMHAEFANGNLALLAGAVVSNAAVARPAVYVVSATLVSIAASGDLNASNYDSEAVVIGGSGDAIVFYDRSATTGFCRRISDTGNLGAEVTIAAIKSAANASSIISAIAVPNVGAAVAYKFATSTPTYGISFCLVADPPGGITSSNIALLGNVINIEPTGSLNYGDVNVIFNGAYHNANIIYRDQLSGSYSITLATSNVMRGSVVGVAAASVAAGASVTINQLGSFAINQTFANNGGGFDQRILVPPGIKGAVFGSQALLGGAMTLS